MSSGSESPASPEWDVFLNYASEDRDTFVTPLRNALAARGVRVWIDYGEITLGDALRKQIDDGLLRSRFAVVVLSPASLDKYWASAEIDALFALEQARGRKCILPVLHQLTHGELTLRRPLLAGRIAEPSHDLNRVVEAIVRVVHGTQAPASGQPRTRTYNLPSRLASFVGRTKDLAAVETALRTKRVAVSAAITGLPGIGKTALVAELAHRLAARGAFPGGIFWLPAEHPDLSLVWAREDLGGQIAPDADPKERSAETVRRLSRTPADLLVILDNVVAWGETTRPLPLPQGEHVYVLVTTRERNLGGTQLTQVPLDVLTPTDARKLLLTTAARDIEPGVDALLAHLDGHALSTELAGVYLREFVEGNAGAYLAKLRAGDGVEAEVPGDRIRHQHTTDPALRTLWDRLDADTRSAWCLAGAFADDPVVFALSDLCGLDEKARARLRRFHLVDIDTTHGQWDAHRLVLEFARRHPDESLRVDAERAFVSGCAQYARQFDLATGYKPYLAARPHVDRAARGDLVERTLGTNEIGAFLDRVGTALQSAGHYALAREQLELALAAGRKHFGDDHAEVAMLRCNLGVVLHDLGDLAGARRELELALAADRKHLGDDHPNVAIDRSNLGLVLKDLGDLAGAEREGREALRVARLQPPGSRVRAGIERAWSHLDPSHFRAARTPL